MKRKDRRKLEKYYGAKQLKKWKVNKPKNGSNLIEYEVVLSCGCCYQSLWFENDAIATMTMKQHIITGNEKDQLGNKIREKIDGFYGIWRKEQRKERHSLSALFNLAFENEDVTN